MTEREVQHMVVDALHAIGNGIPARFYLVGPDDAHFEQRNNCDCYNERYHQVDSDSDWEVFQCIIEGSLHCYEEGIEDDANAQGGQQHGQEILLCRVDSCALGLIAFAQILQISINNHNAVVDNHSKHNNKCCQRDNVELNASKVHNGYRNKGAQGYSDCRHNRRTKWEQHHHHKNDNEHGDEQVAQEVGNANAHHLRLVGYSSHIDIARELVLPVIVKYLLHIATILKHIVAWSHLHRQ